MLDFKRIRKGDQVKVIAGKDLGKTGIVLKINRDKGRILIEGVNLHKKAMRKTQKSQVGGIKDIEMPLNISNIMLVCPKCKKETRVSYKITESKKVRVCKKCSGEI